MAKKIKSGDWLCGQCNREFVNKDLVGLGNPPRCPGCSRASDPVILSPVSRVNPSTF